MVQWIKTYEGMLAYIKKLQVLIKKKVKAKINFMKYLPYFPYFMEEETEAQSGLCLSHS